MAFWDGLLGGGGGDPLDIYGDLFSKEQKAALAQRSAGEGLLRMAGAFGQAAQPSRLPTSFMATLGHAAGAMAGSGDEAAKTALSAMKVGEDVRTSKQQREWTAKLLPALVAKLAALEKANNLPPGALTSQIPGAGAVPATPPEAPVPAPQPPGVPQLNAIGMPPPRDLTGIGIPQRPGAAPPDPMVMGQRGGLPPDQRYNSQGMPISPDLTTNFPGQRSGAAIPPGVRIPADPIPPPTGQQNTGLLPPQDQVVGPDGQPLTGQGILPTMNASYGGLPGGTPPFRLASSTLTSAATPGAAGANAGRQGRVDFWMSQGAPRHVAEGIADRVKAESGFNSSIMGDRGTSGGLYQHHAGRLAQLKQFAAQQNRPWTDPNVQDQFAATEVKGGDAIATRGWSEILNAPDQQAAAKLWDRHFERSAAGPGARGGQDYVIPSGPRLQRSDLTNVADTGGGLSGGGANNMPEQLSTLSAITQLLGLKDPFGSMLETYYKSPNYITEAARARALGESDPLILEQKKRTEYRVDTELKPALEAAVARAMNAPLAERATAQADIDRETKRLEQAGAAGTKMTEVTVADDNGKPVLKKMTELEAAIRERVTNERRANKDYTVRPGDIVGTPVLSPEETAAQTQRGKTGQEMTTVEVWTPAGKVSQPMSNSEAAARRKLASERGPGAPPQVGDIVDAPALTEAEKKVAGALGEDFVALRRQAQAASSTISSTHDLRAKLDSGMFTGMDANWNLFAARLGDTLGWKNLSDPEKVKNTEVYISGIGKEVLAMAQALKPASNLDLQFLERAAGGINLSAASVRELLDMRERYARLAIERHNEEARGMSPGTFSGFRREIPLPTEYQPKELVTPSGNKAKINR